MKDTPLPPEFHDIRHRIAALRARQLEPMEVVMSPETWECLKQQHRDVTPGLNPQVISSRSVFGLRIKLAPGTRGCIIRYFGGMDLPQDQAVTDGFIDLSRLD